MFALKVLQRPAMLELGFRGFTDSQDSRLNTTWFAPRFHRRLRHSPGSGLTFVFIISLPIFGTYGAVGFTALKP